MRFRAQLSLALFLLSGAVRLAAGPYDRVEIPVTKTSIYIGNVTLIPGVLERSDGAYKTSYQAKVFPYFFLSEAGRLQIDFSDEQLAQLERGERVAFSGIAHNKDGETRRIEGHATPRAPGTSEGTIKVRIFVTKKIELIFNSQYRFTAGQD
jgi:hypothetical protein